MNSRNDISNELKELNSSLPASKVPEAYSVPEGYFEGFAASVLQKIRGKGSEEVSEELEELSPLLAGISRKTPFSLPTQYFEKMNEELPAFMGKEELPEMLAALKGRMPYKVPDGYFEELPQQVLHKVQPHGAKVVAFGPRRWMRLAAAAAVTGFIALGAVLYLGQNKTGKSAEQPGGEWVAQKLENVSSQELEEFINSSAIQLSGREMAQRKAPANTTEARKMLRDVSNKELEAFLDEIPTDNEDLMMIN